MKTNKTLVLIISKLKTHGVNGKINKNGIDLNIDFKSVSFLKVKTLLYLLINKFENSYFITIRGLPYCLMPDASNHIIYKKNEILNYQKTAICRKCRHVGSCPGWPTYQGANKNLFPSTIRDLPEEIVLEITQRCNLDCCLCFSQKKLKEIPIKKIKQIIYDCTRLGIKTIRFTGGEPLLYRDLETALNYAKGKKLYVILNTNATIYDEEIKRIFKAYVDNVLISLQGFNGPSENKLTRSKIDFSQKLKNIIEINYTVPTVRIGTIISRTLVDNFLKYYYLLKKIGIKEWELYRPMTSLKDKEFKITHKDLLMIMNNISRVKKDYLNLKIANAIPFCISPDFSLSSYVLLGSDADDGHRRIIFDAGGFFKPSYFINKNLGIEIKQAWDNSFLKKVRLLSYLPEKCQKCFYIRWCKGGSRYWAKITNRDYFAPDPLVRI